MRRARTRADVGAPAPVSRPTVLVLTEVVAAQAIGSSIRVVARPDRIRVVAVTRKALDWHRGPVSVEATRAGRRAGMRRPAQEGRPAARVAVAVWKTLPVAKNAGARCGVLAPRLLGHASVRCPRVPRSGIHPGGGIHRPAFRRRSVLPNRSLHRCSVNRFTATILDAAGRKRSDPKRRTDAPSSNENS